MGIAVALALTTSTPSAAQESNSQTVCNFKENKIEAPISISSVDTTNRLKVMYSLETNEPILLQSYYTQRVI